MTRRSAQAERELGGQPGRAGVPLGGLGLFAGGAHRTAADHPGPEQALPVAGA